MPLAGFRPVARLAFLLVVGASAVVPIATAAQAPHVIPAAAAASGRSAPAAALVARRERGALVLELGPVDLPAGGHEHADEGGHAMMMMTSPPPLSVAVPVDGWLRGYVVDLVDGEGHPVPHELLHHVNVIAPQRRELFSGIMLRVAAAGSETAPVSLPWFVGYRVHPGDTLLVSAMLHNPTPNAYHGVRLRVRFPVRDADAWLGAMSIFPFYLDVMPPAGTHAYDLPPGHSEQYWEGSPAIAGRILGMGGHLHEYGVALRLEDRTEGKVLWEGEPTLDSAGRVVGMAQTNLAWKLGIRMRPDHVYRLTAIYDNPTGATIPDGGMGALGGAFLPSGDTPWPKIDRAAPDYVKDIRVTYRLDQPTMPMRM